MLNVTAELYLGIYNAFNPFPDGEGWRFQLQAAPHPHEGEDAHFFPASRPNSVMCGDNPDLVRQFEKRLSQKFEARFHSSDTYYPNAAFADPLL